MKDGVCASSSSSCHISQTCWRSFLLVPVVFVFFEEKRRKTKVEEI
jgi:hypothetical protein